MYVKITEKGKWHEYSEKTVEIRHGALILWGKERKTKCNGYFTDYYKIRKTKPCENMCKKCCPN